MKELKEGESTENLKEGESTENPKDGEPTESPKEERVVPRKKRGRLTTMEYCLQEENPGIFIDYCRSPNNNTELDALYNEKDDCAISRTHYIMFCFNTKLEKLRKEGSLIPNHTKTHKPDPNHSDESTYTGEVDQNLKACGYGVSVMANGTTYEGTFFNDVFEGVVTIKVDNKVEGVQEYKNGRAFGLGTYYEERPFMIGSDHEGDYDCYNVCPGFPKGFKMWVKTEKGMAKWRESRHYDS